MNDLSAAQKVELIEAEIKRRLGEFDRLKRVNVQMLEALMELIEAHERSYDPVHKEAIAKARAAVATVQGKDPSHE